MTHLSKFFLATAFAAALPAMAAPLPPVVIDFEATATPAVWGLDGDGNAIVLPGTGDGQSVSDFYAANGVTFDSKAFSFYATLNSKNVYGQNVGNLPILPGNLPGSNEVVMAAFQESQTCTDTESCLPHISSISTTASLTKPFNAVEFSYSAATGSSAYVDFRLMSATGALTWDTRQLAASGHFCTVSDFWCEWNTVSYTAPVGSTLAAVEFGGKEAGVFFDNIILTPVPPAPPAPPVILTPPPPPLSIPVPPAIPTPEPSTYALTLLGLVGIRFLAVRRRRAN